jgi:hypothetical protein
MEAGDTRLPQRFGLGSLEQINPFLRTFLQVVFQPSAVFSSEVLGPSSKMYESADGFSS